MALALGSAALPLSLGLALYLLYHGSLTRTIWLSLNLIDTLRALRLIRPNGRAVGQVTRRKAMQQALITWIVFVAGQSVGSIPDRLLGWLPLYDTVKIIVLCGFLATRVITSTSIYRSLLVPFLRKYQTPIDLSLLLIHSILALGVHYLLWIPLDAVRSVSRRVVGFSTGLSRILRPVLVLVSVPLIRQDWGRESKNETETEMEVEVGVEMEAQGIGNGDGDAAEGGGSAEPAPEPANSDDEALRRWWTPGPAIPGRLLRTVRPSLPIARTESGSDCNFEHGEAQDQIPEQARGATTVSEMFIEVDGSSHAGPSTLASTPAKARDSGFTLAVPVVPTPLRRSPRRQRTQAHVGRHDDTRSTRPIPTLAERSNVANILPAINHPDPSPSEDSQDVPKHIPLPLPKVGRAGSQPAPRVPSLQSVNVPQNHFSLNPRLPDPKHPVSISAIPPTSKESVLGNGNGNSNGEAKNPPARINRGKSRIRAASQSLTLGGALQVHSAPTRAPQGIASKSKAPGPQRSNSVVLPVRPLPRSTANTKLTKPAIHPRTVSESVGGAPARSTSAQRVVPLPSMPENGQSRDDPPSAPSQAPALAVTAKARSVRSTTRSAVVSDVPPRGVIAASRVRAAREAAIRGVGGVGGVGEVGGVGGVADKDPATPSVPGKRVAGKSEDESTRRKRVRVGE